ncbi:MAG: hypothetical protein CVV13_11965 [Gammaproteobacteria bacterium HGW-Gammaproteobacteria-3]|nr:MAG: hypothetical protein CVV13_11965 [Gammaproteobacteria bacterium HGW-Gammaproteobacteria-3]
MDGGNADFAGAKICPVIVAENAGKVGQYIHRRHGFAAPLGMGVIQSPTNPIADSPVCFIG